jgi:hypothetical protein
MNGWMNFFPTRECTTIWFDKILGLLKKLFMLGTINRE